MNGTFNPQILVEKLARLNSSQQSIETLSHWCIFHMNKAKQVVETWAKQFHCSPRDQRLSFLYLANDILQNSRRKGSEFVAEFWKFLPEALGEVIENGDEFAKNAALRLVGRGFCVCVCAPVGTHVGEFVLSLTDEDMKPKHFVMLWSRIVEDDVNIWEERKVFGSRGKILKEGIVGRNLENTSKHEKISCLKVKQSMGNVLEKITSSYDVVYNGPVDEESLLSKCRAAIGCVDRVEKEIGIDCSSGELNSSEFVEGQHGILSECVEQLRAVESSRATLVSHLREALQEQEVIRNFSTIELEEITDDAYQWLILDRALIGNEVIGYYNRVNRPAVVCKMDYSKDFDHIRWDFMNLLCKEWGLAAQSRSERAGNICQQLLNIKSGQFAEHRLKEPSTYSDTHSSLVPETTDGREKEQSAPVMYTQRGPLNSCSLKEDDPRKSAAAAVAAKLAASTSSAQMLTYVLSSLASEGVIGSQSTESSSEYASGKRPKLENGSSSYNPSPQHSQPPLPPFPHPDFIQPMPPATSEPLQPPPPSSSPPRHPAPPVQQQPQPPQQPILQPPSTQFMQTVGTMQSESYNYGSAQQCTPPFPGYPMVGAPLTGMPPYASPNTYQSYGPEGGFYSQPPLPASSHPISRQ
ncbi:hypothetical protein IFM89_031157 [Coptis chinensis]|uniref:CID domain-containing protein n=1 Tax=Coptis chinensis TaxID=261450 RepID=A0A835IRP9_9MAGN|nr:hypothetical protein IFM89_031157 [Coptis chinensis]